MIDGVIFDLDGTLWDSTPEILKCWQQYIPDLTLWKLKSCMGMDTETMANELNISIEDVNKIQDLEIAWLSEHTVAPYIGVTGLLQYLNTRQVPCFIVSNCQSRYIECFLYTSGLSEYFKDWLSHGDTGWGKAKNIELLMLRHDLQNVVVVGDTHEDMNAAKLAKAKWFVWASYGFGHADCEYQISEPLGLTRYV